MIDFLAVLVILL